jgi:hypothetical protein
MYEETNHVVLVKQNIQRGTDEWSKLLKSALYSTGSNFFCSWFTRMRTAFSLIMIVSSCSLTEFAQWPRSLQANKRCFDLKLDSIRSGIATTINMPLQLAEGTFEDIHEYISILFAAYSDPLHLFVSMLLPGLGSDDPKLLKQGKDNEAERALARWKANPCERWMKVVDDETREIIG